MYATPVRDGVPARRRAPTPSQSAKQAEEDRQRARPRVDIYQDRTTPESIGREHFGDLTWETKHFTSKLPLCLYLRYHDRGAVTRTAKAAEILCWVREWLASSEFAKVVQFDAETKQISQVLIDLEKHHKDRFRISISKVNKATHFSIEAHPYGLWAADVFGSWPRPWAAAAYGDGGQIFSTDQNGAMSEVVVGRPDIAGGGEVKAVTFNGCCVKGRPEFRTLPSSIRDREELAKVLNTVSSVEACHGVRLQHVLQEPIEGREWFPNVLRTAMRTPEPKDFDTEGRWQNTAVVGFLIGSGGVSGVCGLVGGEHVLWSRSCAAIANDARVGKSRTPRCSACKVFYRESVQRRLRSAARGSPSTNTANMYQTTVQKEKKLGSLAGEKKNLVTENARLRRAVEDSRAECILVSNKKQGEALHEFLTDPSTKRIFNSKLPSNSDQRHFYNDQVRWNSTAGKSKGFRYHPATLRLAVYIHGVAGTSAYNTLRSVMHLPAPSTIRNLRAKAAPARTGVLIDNIQKYGKLAARLDVDKADLMGVLTWDCMHLNKNGFTFDPKGGGFTGLLDPHTFFHPIRNEEGEKETDFEKVVENVIATQYLEVFFVSLGKPELRFAVWREAVRSLNTDYIVRMVTTLTRYLACAHQDKGFDVVATVCDGASEHRSFQTHASTVKFESYKKGPDEEEFADFKVGFRHPVHGEEIFNVSDPMHDMKKLVNALWHSDLPDKPRQLGNFCVDNADGGNLKFVPFSLKTGERVYRGEEFDNDSLTAAERASVWTIHQNISQGVWKRDSYNCMSVSHAAKVVSGTMTGMCERHNEKREEQGQGRDLEVDCYGTFSMHVNNFVDIFNGNWDRTAYERRNGLNPWKGYVKSKDDPILESAMDTLRWFDGWCSALQIHKTPGAEKDHDWKKHFITRESWFDLRLTILGFVSLCRYLFEFPERFQVDSLSDNRRFVNPRTLSQDILEHRFAHIRAGLGTLRNPTASQAKERAVRGDLNRGLHGGSRANMNRNARPGADFSVSGFRGQIMLGVTEEDKASPIRAKSRGTPQAVLFPRYLALKRPKAEKPKEKQDSPEASNPSGNTNPVNYYKRGESTGGR